jgi:hypothetical protein
MANQPYKGKFTNLKNPQKYQGDVSKITYRSLWERNAFRWLDENPEVRYWASEEFSIPYVHPIEGRRAKYFPDIYIEFTNGRVLIVEIKPDKQTRPPETPKRQTKKHINEVATYAINTEKWKVAQQLAHKNNIEFQIWTEHHLEKLGIPTGATETDKKTKRVGKRPQMRSIRRPTRKS